MTNYIVKYSVWERRILPILDVSGWKKETVSGKTYMVNEIFGQRFEYREYGNYSPILIRPLEGSE